MAMLETPSRIWRRIEAVEGRSREMPSLPSLPAFEDSAAASTTTTSTESDLLLPSDEDISLPITSTPAAPSVASTARQGSASRFANSIASRSTATTVKFGGLSASRSRALSSASRRHDSANSFDVSVIPSLPGGGDPDDLELELADRSRYMDEESKSKESSVPDVYLPPDGDVGAEQEEDEFALTEALESISRTGSPQNADVIEQTPRKAYDYSVSLRSEPQPSPRTKFRNVSVRRRPIAPGTPAPARLPTRTPSLSHTSGSFSSSTSSSVHSTPHSTRSVGPASIPLPKSANPSPAQVPLPRSANASPAQVPLPRSATASPAVGFRRTDISDFNGTQEDEGHVYQHESEDDDLGPRGEDAYPRLSSDSSRDLDEHFTLPAPDPSELDGGGETNQSSELLPGSVAASISERSDSREPTFSSDDAPTLSPNRYPNELDVTATATRNNQVLARSPTPLSSPAPSTAFTPTPAVPPRPRARFGTTKPEHEADDHRGREDDNTPVANRRHSTSFLLSVINTDTRTRTRPRFNTPGTARVAFAGATPGIGATAKALPASGVTLRTAFAGATPRMAHPLRQAFAVGSESEEGELGESGDDVAETLENDGIGTSAGTPLARWSPQATPSGSPYDSDRASFISTASSHDLTTHGTRANASFDPVLGMGGGHGVGRFNAGKLNAYLHGLNRRLQEENEGLVDRLRKVEEERQRDRNMESEEGGQREGEGRKGRRSFGVEGKRRRESALGDVEEDVGGEGWAEEKRTLEELVDALRGEVVEKEGALEEERGERARDKERWKERMKEVERGVEGLVGELERKLREAEENAGTEAGRIRTAERRLEEAITEKEAALERAEKAERALESGQELGGELRVANERAVRLSGELRAKHAEISELNEVVVSLEGRVDELEGIVKTEKGIVESLEKEMLAGEEKIAHVEQQAREANEELQATKAYVAELEEGAEAAVERIESLEDELAAVHEEVEKMAAAQDALEGEKERAAELARQMEEALEAAETKMLADEEQLARLKGRVSTLERDLEREKEREKSSMHQQDDPSSRQIPGATDADFEALEEELDTANREIARLATLLERSPARKAIDKAKDTKIEILEREKEELAERVRALRSEPASTPSRLINASGISPIHRQVLSMSIRTPKTPGGPLRDLSWLNNTTGDPTVSPLIAEISRLQRELDRANDSIDDKLDKLEDAGLGVVGLTKKLEDARSRIVALEEEIARLARREDRRVKRLERARCLKCHTKVDLKGLNRAAEGDESSLEISYPSLPSEPPTPPTKTSEALRANLASVNTQLDAMKRQWQDEKRQLLGEKAVLQDAATRLNLQVRNAQDEVKKTEKAGEKARAGVQGELDKAKRAIADLETDLTVERAQLRSLSTERHRVHRDKDDILLQLQRTESDMDDVKRQLQKFKQENHDLETELRVNANAEQKARLLEVRVAENAETIEQLRQERSVLVADHKELQRRFSEASERANRLRDEHAASQSSHDNRRHELDLRLLEIEDLRKALSAQSSELHRTESEKNRIAAEKSDVARTVAALEADLKRVRRDAEAFGRDLKALRAEKEKTETKQKEELSKAERAKKQAQAQIRLLSEQLDGQRESAREVQEKLNGHVCKADERQLSVMKVQHNKECKGLIVQIRYLKAKFTRESSLRCDLGYQKHYLLVLLSRYEKSEQTILASIARIGFPVPPPTPPKKKRSLKIAVLSVVFLLRAKRVSEVWREQSASKTAIAAALQDVRRRRATATS